MGDTIENMDKKIEIEEKTNIFFADRTGFSKEKGIKQMVKQTRIFFKKDRVIKRPKRTLKQHKQISYQNIAGERTKMII